MLATVKSRIENRGWEVVEVRNISYLWVSEIWKVRSTRTPTDLFVYFGFLVDGQDGSNEFNKISWLHATSLPPVDWGTVPEERDQGLAQPQLENCSTKIGRNQDKYFGEFLDILDTWRNMVAKTH